MNQKICGLTKLMYVTCTAWSIFALRSKVRCENRVYSKLHTQVQQHLIFHTATFCVWFLDGTEHNGVKFFVKEHSLFLRTWAAFSQLTYSKILIIRTYWLFSRVGQCFLIHTSIESYSLFKGERPLMSSDIRVGRRVQDSPQNQTL